MNARSLHDSEVPSLRSRIRKATAGAILAAAEEVFADQGLHAARMGDIGARAGVAVGTLYNHFKDREALLAGLLETRFAELLDRLDQAMAAGAKLPYRAQVEGFLAAWFDYFLEHRPFFSILLQGELGRFQLTYPVAAQKPTECMTAVHERVSKLIKRGVREHALRAESAELYPSLLLGIIRGVAMRNLRLEKPGTPIDLPPIVEFFFRGAGA